MIVSQIKNTVPPGTVLPKPEAKADFIVKGWGRRRDEEALIYSIPNHSNPNYPHEKGITCSEFETAYRQVMETGELSRSWFNAHLHACAKEGDCNFTTIGGVFELLGVVVYERGAYRRQ